MVNDRQTLDLTTFAQPPGGGAVEWRISDTPVPYPQAVAAMDEARRRLSDPVERAQYLLASYGGEERDKPLRKREFQSEVMEFEQMATKAREEGDSARLAGVVLEAEEKLASAIMAAGQSFTRLERSLVEEVSGAADALAEARFWRRKVDELREFLGR